MAIDLIAALLGKGTIKIKSNLDIEALACYCVDKYSNKAFAGMIDAFRGFINVEVFRRYYVRRRQMTKTPEQIMCGYTYRTLQNLDVGGKKGKRVTFDANKRNEEWYREWLMKQKRIKKRAKKKQAIARGRKIIGYPKVAYIVNGMVVLGKDQADILGAYSDR